jgi:hypothetical protein
LDYLAFDLNEDDCALLNIPSSLAASIAEMSGDKRTAELLKAERFEQREQQWVKRLTSWGIDSALLVIGARHVDSLGAKLDELGWGVQVAERSWAGE